MFQGMVILVHCAVTSLVLTRAFATVYPTFQPCSADYATACSRERSKSIAIKAAEGIEQRSRDGVPLVVNLNHITSGADNLPLGFYPFVFDTQGNLLSNGALDIVVGLNFETIAKKYNLITNVDEWRKRMTLPQPGYRRYLFRADVNDVIQDKSAYVVPVLNATLFVAVGYINEQLPTDPFCTSTRSDSFCGLQALSSIVGFGQTHVNDAESLWAFEHAVNDLSFRLAYRLDGFEDGNYDDFGLLMSDEHCTLVAHTKFHSLITHKVEDLYSALGWGNKTEAKEFCEMVQTSVENKESSWIRYTIWDPLHPKGPQYKERIAHIAKTEHAGSTYFIGAGIDFRAGERPKGPLNADCSDDFNLPCAFQTTERLAAHAVAHLISAKGSAEEKFAPITHSEEFKWNGSYVFIYDVHKETAVAHGGNATFVGLSLESIFSIIGKPTLNANQLFSQFRRVAYTGGGFVIYDWLDTDMPDNQFQKVTFMFALELDGRQYVGGVGFANNKAPREMFVDGTTFGLKRNGEGILCSAKYAFRCNEVNALSLLGDSVSVLIASSTAATVETTNIPYDSLDDAFNAINEKEQRFKYNDLSVTIVSFDNATQCDRFDSSGCIVATSSDEFIVGNTWQQMVDMLGIRDLDGKDLHAELSLSSFQPQSNTSVTWTMADGGLVIRRFWTSRFRGDQHLYYAFVHYDLADLPHPCSKRCPDGMSCTRPDQDFCELKKPTSILAIALALLLGVPLLTILVGLMFYCRGFGLFGSQRTLYKWRGWLPVHVGELRPCRSRIYGKTKVFLCHRGNDTKETIARPTAFFLDQCGVSRFFDSGIDVGNELEEVLSREAYECTTALVVLSPSFRDKPYPVRELNTFLRRRDDESDSLEIMPVLFGIEEGEIGRAYPKRLKLSSYLSAESSETANPAQFLVDKLWPALRRRLDPSASSVWGPDRYRDILRAYVESERGNRTIDSSTERYLKITDTMEHGGQTEEM